MIQNNPNWINGEELIKKYYLDDDGYKEMVLEGKLYPYDTSMKRCYCCHLDEEINGVYRIIAQIDGKNYKCFYKVEDLKKLLFRSEEAENCIKGEIDFEPTIAIQPDNEGFIEYLRNIILPTTSTQLQLESNPESSLCISRKDISNKTEEEIIALLKSDKNSLLLSEEDKIIIAFALRYSEGNPKLHVIGDLIHDKRNLATNTYESYARKYINIAREKGYKIVD